MAQLTTSITAISVINRLCFEQLFMSFGGCFGSAQEFDAFNNLIWVLPRIWCRLMCFWLQQAELQ
ncbi:MAG: hypothetical protein DMG31_15085 [Acidobacteria bacterium]|nr:MAG: hypothetical protein DMG31_15085 [Acidobacteriota bacterium]